MDWAGLPPELLDAILAKLIECTDHLRFSCVCRSWRSAARSHRMPSSLPWLFLPHDPSTTILQFYSFSEDRIYKISFPEIHNSVVIESASGFLLILGACHENPKMLIINAFTGTRVHLPYTSCYFPNSATWDYSGSIIVGKFGYCSGVVYCRPGDRGWTRIEARIGFFSIDQIVYKAGSFYLRSKAGEIYVLDGERLELIRIIQPPHVNGKVPVFVLSPDDILLYNFSYIAENRRVPALFNLNSILEELSWSQVTDIGNYAMFSDSHADINVYGNASHCNSNFYFLSEASRHIGLSNTFIHYRLGDQYMDSHTCYIYGRNLRSSTVKLKGQCSCSPSSNPSWLVPNFDTAKQ
ncbi:F-box family protein [Rhynchospora pubera]|uniref:F-box family protein n=1 Tax=Rhynchospora pubera TaxID=906938 RepID=A0AAV8F5A2_9POAL|nr:F-box family protein [Rhynchospora pubera]